MSTSTPEWLPTRTWVFAIGIWDDEGRRDAVLVQALERRGVPPAQVTFLKNEAATRQAVLAKFEQVLDGLPPDATLLFYFAGHGQRDEETGLGHLQLHRGLWALPDLFATLEQRFGGAQAMLFADSCYSGGLAHEALLRTARVPCAVLSSSQSSTESTREWAFTNCLVAALRGELPGPRGARFVSLLDVAQHVQKEMAYGFGQLPTFVCTNGFNPAIAFAAAAAATDASDTSYVLARAADGDSYAGRIVERRGTQVRIRWAGYGQEDDEWVGMQDTQALRPPEHP
ncbi:MAG TPA: caspase family protein, partial [Ramlibacter sp.]